MATAKKSTDIVAPGSRLVSNLTPMTPSERVWYIVSALPTLGLGKNPVMDRAMSAFVYADPLWTKYANVDVVSATNRAALLALMLMTGVASGKGASQVGRSSSSSSSSSSSAALTPIHAYAFSTGPTALLPPPLALVLRHAVRTATGSVELHFEPKVGINPDSGDEVAPDEDVFTLQSRLPTSLSAGEWGRFGKGGDMCMCTADGLSFIASVIRPDWLRSQSAGSSSALTSSRGPVRINGGGVGDGGIDSGNVGSGGCGGSGGGGSARP
jgi:hypothetical protein